MRTALALLRLEETDTVSLLVVVCSGQHILHRRVILGKRVQTELRTSSSAFPSCISGVHLLLLLRSTAVSLGSPSSSSAFPSCISEIHLLLLRSPAVSLRFTFFFCVPQLYLSGSPLLRSPAVSLGFTFFFFCVPQLYLWGSPSSSAFPICISGVHLLLLRSPVVSLGFTFFFCLPQLYLWGSPSSSAFPSCISGINLFLLPSYISGVHLLLLLLLLLRSPAVSLGFTFFFFCLPQLYL